VKRAVILHGTLGSPEGNWFRWLESELKKRGYEVWLPTLPHTEQPSLRVMSDFVYKNAPFPLDGTTLLIGHSSGAILALIIAQQSKTPLAGLVGVSVFHDNSLNWSPNSKLFDISFDFEAIQRNTHKILFVHSDNDPYVPLDQARYVADTCQAKIVIIPGQGHFNLEQSPTYTQFPKLIETMEQQHNL